MLYVLRNMCMHARVYPCMSICCMCIHAYENGCQPFLSVVAYSYYCCLSSLSGRRRPPLPLFCSELSSRKIVCLCLLRRSFFTNHPWSHPTPSRLFPHALLVKCAWLVFDTVVVIIRAYLTAYSARLCPNTSWSTTLHVVNATVQACVCVQ